MFTFIFIYFYILTSKSLYSFNLLPIPKIFTSRLSPITTLRMDSESLSKTDIAINQRKYLDGVEKTFYTVKGSTVEHKLIKDSLTIFIIDTSVPRGNKRIEAVKRAVALMLPKSKVAIISCSAGDAVVNLMPTSSFIDTNRAMTSLISSVMGNLGAGLSSAVEVMEKSVESGIAKDINIVALVDGKAHGLISTSMNDCDWKDSCDFELYEAAVTIAQKVDVLKNIGVDLRSIIIDTETLEMDSSEWSVESVGLAKACKGHYYHAPLINDDILIRIISEVSNME